VVEQGTHSELMALDGLYKQLGRKKKKKKKTDQAKNYLNTKFYAVVSRQLQQA